jgi:hypothetical protein
MGDQRGFQRRKTFSADMQRRRAVGPECLLLEIQQIGRWRCD